MLLDDDVMADGEPEAGAFSRWLGREKRIEHLVFHVGWYAGAVVAYPDLDAVTAVLRCGTQRRFIGVIVRQYLALRRRIEAVRNQVEKHPGDFLRESVSLAGGRIKGPLQGDIEAVLLGPGAVIGEIKAFFDDGIDVDGTVFARAFARMQQHVLDDRVRHVCRAGRPFRDCCATCR